MYELALTVPSFLTAKAGVGATPEKKVQSSRVILWFVGKTALSL